MELSPEERRRIYEEEKARIDAKAQSEREKSNIPPETTVNLPPRVAGLLCYLGFWITGIIFLVIEQKNRWVRFHAAQSIVTFGALFVASMVLGWIPYIGDFFQAVLGILGVILWIVLMVKAYSGERYKLPWAGDVAEMIVGPTGSTTVYPPPPAAGPPPQPEVPSPPSPPPPPPPPTPPAPSTYAAAAPPVSTAADKDINRRIEAFFSHKGEGNITGSAFAIAWSIILIIFFNFFWQYIAYYSGTSGNGIVDWTREPFFTNDIKLWLPILNAALAVSIISHLVMILVEKNLLRQALYVIMDGFGLATVITLLVISPFDFSMLPNDAAITGTTLGVTVALTIIAIGFGISLLVRFIKLLVGIGQAVTRSR